MFSTGYVFDESLLEAFQKMSGTDTPIKLISGDGTVLEQKINALMPECQLPPPDSEVGA
jgi:hypothetical protein